MLMISKFRLVTKLSTIGANHLSKHIRAYIFISGVTSSAVDGDIKQANGLTSGDLLPRVRYVNGEFICPWSEETKKDFSSTMSMIIKKLRRDFGPKVPYLGMKDSTATFRNRVIDFAKLVNNDFNVTWLGHATSLVRMGKIGILTDPVWNESVGPPILANFLGPRRILSPPASVSDITKVVDVILISHSHYDHLDLETAKEIGDSKLWIVPMGVKSILKSAGVTNCVELNWWDSYSADINGELLEITFTPTKHWSARTFYDRNTSLWGSYVIFNGSRKLFFGGDTAYCSVFSLIGERYGPFDLSLIPIGAYKPRWFMKDVHCNPSEAIQIHKDIRSKRSLAIHWGTYPLAEEDAVEPALELARERDKLCVEVQEFFTMMSGETLNIDEDLLPLSASSPSSMPADYATVQQPALYERFLKEISIDEDMEEILQGNEHTKSRSTTNATRSATTLNTD